jgi:glycosyltransferase involved in cell wall biosynthesis
MQAVLEKNDVDLLVVGEFWHDKNIYLEEIDILGIGKNVIIVDKYIPNEEVGLYFSAADVVVLPYISASQSGIIQIAYGFNRPVITTDVGGLPDVVEDGVTGFIVPARNSKALSDSIIRYFDGMYEKRFEENIKNMKNIYSWEKFVDLFGKFLIDRAS